MQVCKGLPEHKQEGAQQWRDLRRRRVGDWVGSRMNSILEMRIWAVKGDREGQVGWQVREKNWPFWSWRRTGSEF